MNALCSMSARKRSAHDAALPSSASSAKLSKHGNVNSVVSSARRACEQCVRVPLSLLSLLLDFAHREGAVRARTWSAVIQSADLCRPQAPFL